MASVMFKGKALRPKPFLSGVDVAGGDLTATVKFIDPRHKAYGGTTAVLVLNVRGEDEDKKLRINAAIESTMASMYGDDPSKWYGKQVVLYLDPNVEMKGRRVGGVRIRKNGKAQVRQNNANPEQSKAHREGLLAGVFNAVDLDELTMVSEGIKKLAPEMTDADLENLRIAYRVRTKELTPGVPKEVPHNPETGEVIGDG